MHKHIVIKPIHPFPARMAPELVWDGLPKCRSRLRILDPMAGSGTTLVTARLLGHDAIGYDRDPLAVLIARSWLANVRAGEVQARASQLVNRARLKARKMFLSDAYPRGADEETKTFVRYWFDAANRIQLAALASSISEIHSRSARDLMWCAFSRLIITKQVGASLAMDISHSRPHRAYDRAPVRALDNFERAVKHIINASPFSDRSSTCPAASVRLGDARRLPLRKGSVDMVITSPPYLNAIDYIRGHKFSLVWMGYSIRELRKLRSANVGTENTSARGQYQPDAGIDRIVKQMCDVGSLPNRQAEILRQYTRDMKSILMETHRALRDRGKAVFVVGNCNIGSTFVRNSKCIQELAKVLGFVITKIARRKLPENRRYLPPPGLSNVGKALRKRLREEVILTMTKG